MVMMNTDNQLKESDNSSNNKKLIPYLRDADAVFKNGFENDDMQSIFLENVFDEIAGQEVELSSIKSASFILQDFLYCSSLTTVDQFLTKFLTATEKIVCSEAACHILQVILERFIIVLSRKVKNNQAVIKNISEKIKTMADNLLNNEDFVSFITDIHATHAIRALLSTLSGALFKNSSSTYKGQNDLILISDDLPLGFLSKLKSFSKALEEIPTAELALLFTNINGCPCLSHCIKVLKLRLPKRAQNFCKTILKGKSDDNNTQMILILSKDKIGSRLLETIIEIDSMWDIIYEAFDEDGLSNLCLHPVGNFVFQKLITFASEEKLTDLMEVISSNIMSIFIGQKFGIIFNLSKKCLEFKEFQAEFLNLLLKMLQCKEMEKRKYIIPLAASLMTHDEFIKSDLLQDKGLNSFIITYHGSLLLQTLMNYDNIGLLLKSISEIPHMFIVKLACNAKGSHFIDEVLKCDKVKIKKKRQILNQVKENLAQIACDKYGSRVLDNVWKVSDIEMKIIIATQLSQNKSELQQNIFGKHIVKTFGIKQFNERRNKWIEYQRQNENKRKIFQDIFSSDKDATKSKQRKKE